MRVTGHVHLEVMPVPTGGRGLAVLSRHPGAGAARLVVIVSDPSGIRCGVGRVEADAASAIEDILRSANGWSSASLPIAMLGTPVDAATILAALAYPTDERATAAPELARVIEEMRPEGLAESMDQRAASALAAVPEPTLLDLQFYSGEGQRAERRRQAAAGFPLLAGIIASTLSLKIAADRAKPLLDEIVKALDGKTGGSIGRAAVRKLAAVREPPRGTDIDTVIEFASRVSPDWIPTGGDEWGAFCSIADALVRKLGATADETSALLKGCAGRWVDYRARIATASAGGDRGAIPNPELTVPTAMRDVHDMIECFANVVVVPLAAHGHGATEVTVTPELRQRSLAVARMMLLGDRSAPAITDLSRRWHAQRAALLDMTRIAADERRSRLIGDIEEGGWPLLSDAVQAPNGVWLVPLGTPTLLQWEGSRGPDPNGVEGLHHCVGGYSSRCLTGDSHIVSVRTINDEGIYERLSTIEFARLDPRADRLSIVQNRGVGNGAVSGPAQDATAWYVDAVARGEIALHRDRINAFQELNGSEVDGVERFCGYDWRDRAMLNAAIAPWGSFVDHAWRGYGLDALLGSDTLAWVRDVIAPELLLARR